MPADGQLAFIGFAGRYDVACNDEDIGEVVRDDSTGKWHAFPRYAQQDGTLIPSSRKVPVWGWAARERWRAAQKLVAVLRDAAQWEGSEASAAAKRAGLA